MKNAFKIILTALIICAPLLFASANGAKDNEDEKKLIQNNATHYPVSWGTEQSFEDDLIETQSSSFPGDNEDSDNKNIRIVFIFKSKKAAEYFEGPRLENNIYTFIIPAVPQTRSNVELAENNLIGIEGRTILNQQLNQQILRIMRRITRMRTVEMEMEPSGRL